MVRTGDVVGDRFTVERLAGSGGMATVFRALDAQTGAAVALKVIDGGDATRADRFAREARALAELVHPAIVRYVGHGAAGDELYLAMEWLDGEDLAAHLARGGLTIAESVALARQVAGALGFAHARGSSIGTSSRRTSSSSMAASTG